MTSKTHLTFNIKVQIFKWASGVCVVNKMNADAPSVLRAENEIRALLVRPCIRSSHASRHDAQRHLLAILKDLWIRKENHICIC